MDDLVVLQFRKGMKMMESVRYFGALEWNFEG